MIVRDAEGHDHHFPDEWDQDFEIPMVPQRDGAKLLLHPWCNMSRPRSRAGSFAVDAKIAHQKKTVLKGLERCGIAPELPIHIVLTRVAYRGTLDDDNLSNCMKFVRDQVARWLGLPSDRQRPGFRFFYAQQRTSREGFLGVRVTIITPD